jgi:Thioredoxin
VEAKATPSAVATAGPAPTSTHDIDALLAGVPQTGGFLGSPKAPVTLQYFIDIVCPPARELTMGPLASIIRAWVRPGRLRIEFRSINESTASPEAFEAEQAAALAAGMQDKLWYYLEYLYRAQQEELGLGYTDSCSPREGLLQAVAPSVPGLDLALWNEDTHNAQLASQIAAEERAAMRAGLESPAFRMERTGARSVMKLPDFARVDPAYKEVARELLTAKFNL